MKKIYSLLAILLIAGVCFSQSQRLVMFEEFTQASCPPCATTNPALNALLNANSDKVVSVKYQTSWPGYDPMNVQNPTQVQSRVTYYNVTGVPHGKLDGGLGFSGQPAGLTQTNINTRYASPSPFTIDVSHYLSPNNDSIYCHATITCTQAVSGTLKAHMAVIERMVYFTNPPGTNGEKTFEGVMKRMLPSDQGTALAATYNPGDIINVDNAWALSNVYDINQLAVVVWVQDNANKNVHQAGYSRPHITDDAGITDITSTAQCSANMNVSPVVNLHNFAISALTQVNINYLIDGGPVQTYVWSGTLAPFSDLSVTLPGVAVASTGIHTVTSYTSMPNGVTDMDTHNDQTTQHQVAILPPPVVAPLMEDFVLATFPPAGWLRLNVSMNAYQWVHSTAGYNGANGSAAINFYLSPAGSIQNLYAQTFDYSSAIAGSTLEFDLAHAMYNSLTFDRLQVNISTDCGVTWTNVYDKSDPQLMTHSGYVSTAWTAPNTSTDWRHEVINMDAFIGQPEVMAEFKALSASGNYLYIDNVNIRTAPLGINSVSLSENINVYPVPSSGIVTLDVNFESAQNLKVAVYNLVGEVVSQFEIGKTIGGSFPINLSKVAEGAYTVKISTDSETVVKSLNIVK
ncbi:MAG TPA: T9SS type A sorting domain-containing protein [Bacteroidia bacterium]|nr:T9SS type A sorting domain-containing protein [Bacteroidia bacterium]